MINLEKQRDASPSKFGIKNGTKKDTNDKQAYESKTEKIIDHIEQFSPKLRKFMIIRRYFYSIFVRLIFMALPSFHIYYLGCIYETTLIWALYASYALIILDGIWVVWKRGGRDYYWFVKMSFVYLIEPFQVFHLFMFKGFPSHLQSTLSLWFL